MKKIITLILILIISFNHLNIFEVFVHFINDQKSSLVKEINSDESEKDEAEKKVEVLICENNFTEHVNCFSKMTNKFNLSVSIIFPPFLDKDEQPPKLNNLFI